jgi:hypothetical protein
MFDPNEVYEKLKYWKSYRREIRPDPQASRGYLKQMAAHCRDLIRRHRENMRAI